MHLIHITHSHSNHCCIMLLSLHRDFESILIAYSPTPSHPTPPPPLSSCPSAPPPATVVAAPPSSSTPIIIAVVVSVAVAAIAALVFIFFFHRWWSERFARRLRHEMDSECSGRTRREGGRGGASKEAPHFATG